MLLLRGDIFFRRRGYISGMMEVFVKRGYTFRVEG